MDWILKNVGSLSPFAQQDSQNPRNVLFSSANLADPAGDGICCKASIVAGSFGDDADGEQLKMLFEDFRGSWTTYIDLLLLSQTHADSSENTKSKLNSSADIAFGGLEIFLKAFNLRFREYVPSHDEHVFFFKEKAQPIPVWDSKSSSKDKSVPKLLRRNSASGRHWSNLKTGEREMKKSNAGHPHDMIVSLINVLNIVCSNEHAEFFQDVIGLLRLQMLTRAFEILCRYDYNRSCLINHGSLKTLLTTLQEVTIWGPKLAEKPQLPNGYSKNDVRTLVVEISVLILQVIRVCSDPADKLKEFVQSGGEIFIRNYQIQNDSDIVTNSVEKILQIIQISTDEREKSSEFSLRFQSLVTLGSLIMFYPKSCEKVLLQNKGLETLMEQIRWPWWLSATISEVQHFVGRLLRMEFRCQLLTWYIGILLSRSSSECRKVLNNINVVGQIFEWVAYAETAKSFESNLNSYNEFFPEFNLSFLSSAVSLDENRFFSVRNEDQYANFVENLSTSPDTLQPQFIPPWCNQIEFTILRNILYKQCLLNSTISFGDDEKENDVNDQNVDDDSLFKHLLLNSEFSDQIRNFIGIFVNFWNERIYETPSLNDVDSRNLILGKDGNYDRTKSSRLPLHALFLWMLSSLLELNNDKEAQDGLQLRRKLCFKIMEENSVLELLMSTNFYFWKNDRNPNDDARKQLIYAVSEFLARLASLSPEANLKICKIVISKAVENIGYDAWVSGNLLGVLKAMIEIQTQKSQTQVSLRSIGALQILAPAFRRSLADLTTSEGIVWQFLSLFDLMFFRDRLMSCHLFEESGFSALIFELLTHQNPALSDFAFRQIISVLSSLPVQYPKIYKLGIVEVRPQSPKSNDNEIRISDFYSQYFESFPLLIDSDKSYRYIKKLLGGIRLAISYATSSSERKAIQLSFVDARAFEHILAILSTTISVADASSRMYEELVEDVLRSISSLMQGNDECKRNFRDIHGYETIKIRVFVNGSLSPWDGFLYSLMALLFDAESWTPGSKLLVRNADVIDALLDMYQHFDKIQQLKLLDYIISAASMHERNRLVLQRAKLIPKIIKKLLPQVSDEEQLQRSMELIETIALVSLTTSDVKLMLSQLNPRPENGDFSCLSSTVRRKLGVFERYGSNEKSGLILPYYYDHLLKSTLKIARKKEQNLDFFYFLGNHSGICLPALGNWPPSLGFTFSTWFRIDAFSENEVVNEDCEPRLFSMLDAEGNGSELYVKDQILTYSVIKNGSSWTVSMPEFPLLPNKWYFISLIQQPPNFPWTALSEVSFYLNGNIRLKAKMSFPNADIHEFCCIGAKVLTQLPTSSTLNDEDSDRVTLRHCFAGQMTSVYFFDEPLSIQELHAIYKLGTGYSVQFRNGDMDIREGKRILPGEPTIFDGSLYSKIFVQFHPSATENEAHCFDVSPRSIATQFAATINNMITYSTKCFRTSIHALGGIEIIFPIGLHLDLAKEKPPFATNNIAELESEQTRINLFLRLLSMLLEDDPIHQARFLELRGGQLLSMLLQQSNPANLTMATLDSMMALIKSQSGGSNSSGDLQLYRSLAFDMRLWAGASAMVQEEYFQFVQHFMTNNLQLVRSQFGITFWLDILDQYYWYNKAENVPVDMQRVFAAHPDLASVSHIRRVLWTVIKQFIETGITNEEAKRIVQVLWVHTDEAHVNEFINILSEMVMDNGISGAATPIVQTAAEESGAEIFVQKFLENEGLELILELVGNNDEPTRLCILNLMFEILISQYTTEKWKNKMRFLDNEKQVPEGETPFTPAILKKMLNKFSMGIGVYWMLLQCALESRIVDLNSRNECRYFGRIAGKEIQSHSICQTILEQLDYQMEFVDLAQLKLRKAVLDDFVSLLCPLDQEGSSTSRSNCIKIRKISRWQALFFNLIPRKFAKGRGNNDDSSAYCTSLESANSSKGSESGPDTTVDQEDAIPDAATINEIRLLKVEIAESVYWIIASLLYDSFEDDRTAWRLVEETSIIIWLSRPEKSEGISIIRNIFSYLLRRILDDAKLNDPRDYSHAKLENILHTLLLAEEFMFNHQDLKEALQREMFSMPTTILEFQSTPSHAFDLKNGDIETSSLIITLENSLNIRSSMDEVVVRMSLPFAECYVLATDYAEALTTLISAEVISIPLSSFGEKSHVRVGGLIRLQFRILLASLSMPDEKMWKFAVEHLEPLIRKHSETYSASEPKSHLFNVIGHMHVCFKIAMQNRNQSVNSGTVPSPSTSTARSELDYLTILPLYMETVRTWKKQILSSLQAASLTEESLEISTSSTQVFVEFLQSSEWTKVCDTILYPAMKEVEEEMFGLVPLMTRRYARIVKTLVPRIHRDDQRVKKVADSFEVLLQNSFKQRMAEELDMKNQLISNSDSQRHSLMKSWTSLFRELVQERAIWCMEDGNSQTYWKLDRTENYSRMRRKTIHNYEFDVHADAAAKRDKNPRSEFDNNVERKKSLFHKYKTQLSDNKTAELEEDEWNLIDESELSNPTNVSAPETGGLFFGGDLWSYQTERVVYRTECEMILFMTSIKGRLEVTTTAVRFYIDMRAMISELNESEQNTVAVVESEVLRDRRWPLSTLREIHQRRYMLRNSAIELFLLDQTNYFFNFSSPKEKTRVYSRIAQLRPPNLVSYDRRTQSDLLKRTNLTQRWQNHEISNFEYLMHLNTISGRTYNDLTQYPVFPWILNDYDSENIDLTDPAVYRDLSKPIGALNSNRLKQYLDRYQAFEDPNGEIKPFLYGTHYSSAATCLFYLIRMEPFTSLHIALQGGKFDHPDRQFHSLSSTWNSCLTASGDVKELIPEFFYNPDFLRNENGFNLGTRQSGDILGDVVLPKWASSPEEFIRLHREALEGEYVSNNLHHWIDLIWGYKQTGQEAIDANNLFYYLTYEGAIDIDSIKDPLERRSIEDQINNFGQTPSQLFTKPHPPRSPKIECVRATLFSSPRDHKSYLIQLKNSGLQFIALCGSAHSLDNSGSISGLMPSTSFAETVGTVVAAAATAGGLVSGFADRVVTVDRDLSVGIHRWSMNAFGSDIPFSFEPDSTPSSRRRLPSQPATRTRLHAGLFAATKDGRYLISAGHWDGSFRVSPIDINSSFTTAGDIVYAHHDIVTALAFSEDGRVLLTGSRDTTVMSWDLSATSLNDGSIIKRGSEKIFYGHDDEVSSVAINMEHDIVLSGSIDGTCVVHSFHDAKYVRTLRPTSNFKDETLTAHMIIISKQGALIIYSEPVSSNDVFISQPIEKTNIKRTLSRPHSRKTTDSESSNDMFGPNSPNESANRPIGGADTKRSFLHSYTVNGRLVRERTFDWKLSDMKSSVDGLNLVAADDRGGVCLIRAHSLQISHRFDVSVNVFSLALSDNQQFLFLGRVDGKLLLIAIDALLPKEKEKRERDRERERTKIERKISRKK